MARRSRNRTERDVSPIATTVLRPTLYSRVHDPVAHILGLRDARFFSFDSPFDDVSSPRRDQRFVVEGRNVNSDKRNVQRSSPFSNYFKFAVPEKVTVCVRRKQRREVLFAKRKTGKGAKARRRRNYYTAIHC